MKTNKIKKITLILVFSILIITGTACSSNREGMVSKKNNLKIVTTIFPAYDWTRNILGDNISKTDLVLLCDKGVDIHSYQPSMDDILTISDCDIFIYVGGESETWVDDALRSAGNTQITVIDLLELLGDSAKEEEIIEGMQAEEETEEADSAPEYDEHVWLSLKNAKLFCTAINSAIVEKKPSIADSCNENLNNYLDKLDESDGQFEKMLKNSKQNTLIFGDRFPFRYFVDDYNLKYYAAFIGCSAESEASFDTITFLADKINEIGANAIFILESSDGKLAKTIIETSGRNSLSIVELNSMQSITQQKISDGATYLNIMQTNLESLRTALAD